MAKREVALTMSDRTVDPVHYAWDRCNKGVDLPIALRLKNTGVSPLASSLSNAWRIPTALPVSPEQAAERAAIHSWMLGRGPLRQKKAAT